MMNLLTGTLPDGILEKWDRNEFELSVSGNPFSNMVASARIELSASGVKCAYGEDVRYFVELSEEGKAHFESIRCGKRNTEYILARDGQSPSLTRLSRGLARLGFKQLQSAYSYPFTFATHQTYVRTIIRFGDNSVKIVETYGGQGPIESWLAEQAVLGLVQQVRWEREYRVRAGR